MKKDGIFPSCMRRTRGLRARRVTRLSSYFGNRSDGAGSGPEILPTRFFCLYSAQIE